MILRFPQLDCDVTIESRHVATLQVEDRPLFARIVSSLGSGAGDRAAEPYLVVGDDGKVIPAKKAFFVVNTLPDVPLADRTMLTKLYQRMALQSETDAVRFGRLRENAAGLQREVAAIAAELWGDYELVAPWDIGAYLKTFGFAPIEAHSGALLDRCIRLIDLCVDVADERTLALVNAKSFFSPKELEKLFEHAVFSEKRMVLLESWHDNTIHVSERKVVIDQHFLVS